MEREELEDEFMPKKNSSGKKEPRNTLTTKANFIRNAFIGFGVLLVYYFVNYYLALEFYNESKFYLAELNNTASVSPYFWFAMNA